MSEPHNTAATTAKTIIAGGSGIVVWGLSLNELAAMCSIIYVVTLILEKWGITGYIKRRLAKLIGKVRDDDAADTEDNRPG